MTDQPTPEISAAEAVIRRVAEDLTADLRAKGYPKARAEIQISHTGPTVVMRSASHIESDAPRIFPHTYGGPTDYAFCSGNLDEAIAEARRMVASVEDACAADAWFDEQHPLNQRAA